MGLTRGFMEMKVILENRRAQTAIEYILLLGAVAVVVLLGFRIFLPKSHDYADLFFNVAVNEIMGPPAHAVGDSQIYP